QIDSELDGVMMVHRWRIRYGRDARRIVVPQIAQHAARHGHEQQSHIRQRRGRQRLPLDALIHRREFVLDRLGHAARKRGLVQRVASGHPPACDQAHGLSPSDLFMALTPFSPSSTADSAWAEEMAELAAWEPPESPPPSGRDAYGS